MDASVFLTSITFPIITNCQEKVYSTKEYYLTVHWEQTKFLFKKNHYTKKCQCCGKTSRLQVHHKTYLNIGNETKNDLSLLCMRCHKLVHVITRENSEKNRTVFYGHVLEIARKRIIKPKKNNKKYINKTIKKNRNYSKLQKSIWN